MTISASFKKKRSRFFSERIHAPADSFISKNEGMNEIATIFIIWAASAHVGLAENALGLSDVASWRRGLVPALSVTFPLVACGRLSARLPDGRLQASDRYHWTPS
jgi:hypothetical protein